MRYLTLLLVLTVLGCVRAKDEGDWVDKKWKGSSEDWKRGYRDYNSDVSEEYKGLVRDIGGDLSHIKICERYLAESEAESMPLDTEKLRELHDRLIADQKREIAELYKQLDAKVKLATAAKEKLKQRAASSADEYWQGLKFAELEVNNWVMEQQIRDDEKAREEGKHLKKVLENAR